MAKRKKRTTASKGSECKAAEAAVASGNALYEAERYSDARLAYEKAIGIYTALADESNFNDYLKELAPLYRKLADTYYWENNLGEATGVLVLAAVLYEGLPDEGPMYFSNLAHIHEQIGYNYHCMARYRDAEKEYLLAKKFYDELMSNGFAIYIPNSANICHSLGEVYCNMKRYSDAEAEYLEEIELTKQLVELTPQIVLPTLAKAYCRMAQFYQSRSMFEDAAMMMSKGQKILDKVIMMNLAASNNVSSRPQSSVQTHTAKRKEPSYDYQ